jgi:NAD(P)-dependent dehydrogenase (short-subunit alcohol dehydrogenase family)
MTGASSHARNPFDLRGHVALITGGNGGIGLGMGRALASAGADVAIWGRNEDKNRAAVEELTAIGVRSLAVRCDITREQEVESAFAHTVAALGKVDSCFANAGSPPSHSPFVEQQRAEWRKEFDISLEGTMLTLRAAARHMVDRGDGGSLVAVSSLASEQGLARGEAYAAGKAGMVAVIRGLAVELARHRVRANAILPGFILTDMAPEFLSTPFTQRVLPRVPARRWGEPSDFGGVAVYLASRASDYHTGDALRIDGGYSLF